MSSSQYNLYLIREENLKNVPWNKIRELMERALKFNHGELDFEDYKRLILKGSFQLWLDCNIPLNHIRGIGVTRFIEEDKVVRILLYSNESTASYLKNAKGFEDWCLRFGAKEVEFWGREGWKKVLIPLGYELKYIVMRKKLGE